MGNADVRHRSHDDQVLHVKDTGQEMIKPGAVEGVVAWFAKNPVGCVRIESVQFPSLRSDPVVIGNQADKVKEVVSGRYRVQFAFQKDQLGTGHAVQCAIPSIPDHVEEVLILCGDVPMVRPETLQWLVEDHVAYQRDVSVLSVDMDDPGGYGRVVYDDNGKVRAIVEQADATEDEKKIRTINTGI